MRCLPIVVALSLLPVTARGALTLRVDDVQVRPGETTFVEAYFTETPPAVNERLLVYGVNLGISGNPGVRFGPAEQVGRTVDHPFVFPFPPQWVEILPEVTDESLFASVNIPSAEPDRIDIADGAGALRFAVTAAPGTPAGQASLVFDLGARPDFETAFTDETGTPIPFTVRNGTITIVPEPSSAAALSAAAAVLLRRQRRDPGKEMRRDCCRR